MVTEPMAYEEGEPQPTTTTRNIIMNSKHTSQCERTVEVSVVAATGFDPPQPARASAAQAITAAFLCIAAA